jgi:hypothetical protein
LLLLLSLLPKPGLQEHSFICADSTLQLLMMSHYQVVRWLLCRAVLCCAAPSGTG